MTFSDPLAKSPLPDFVAGQIRDLSLNPDRPLIITDADEVIVHFVRPLENYLASQGLYLDLKSFRLTGNIKSRKTGEAVGHDQVMDLISQFFTNHVSECPAVDHAAETLAALSMRADILILTNVPMDARSARIKALRRLGMDYPLVANAGLKGPAIRALTRDRPAPAVFLDDIPHNHDSAAQDAADVYRIHFVADPRLSRLLGPADAAHTRIDDWREVYTHLTELFDRDGF